VTYRGGISRSKGSELTGRLLGRWRGRVIDVNFDYQKWSRHEQASRHLRYIPATLYSQTLSRLLWPDLALIGALSGVVIGNNLYCEAFRSAASAGGGTPTSVAPGLLEALPVWLAALLPSQPFMITLPTEPLALSGFALGLLVTFRTQTCYSRYAEARLLWGEVINMSRDAGSRILCAVEPTDAPARAERERALRLLLTFAKALKYHLTIDGCNQHIEIKGCTEEEIQGEKDAALRDELTCVWAPDGADEPIDSLPDRLVRTSVGHRPLFVLHELGELLRGQVRSGRLSELTAVQINERLLNLVRAVGGCERIFRTPIYTPYNHHTSRFLILWTAALPAAMYPVLGPAGTAPVSLLIAWMMLGIEDIGSRIENPMDSLPLWQYVDTIEQSIDQLRAHDREQLASAALDLGGGAPAEA
jgi:putative membrane protein